MMDTEIEELRRTLENLPRRGDRRIYTVELEQWVLEVVEKLVATGLKTKAACEALGIHQETVTALRQGRRRKISNERGRVVPVVVTKSPAKKAKLTLVLPGGRESRDCVSSRSSSSQWLGDDRGHWAKLPKRAVPRATASRPPGPEVLRAIVEFPADAPYTRLSM